ncbi:MAG: DNA polymerase III subunit delta' [Hyphomicrobiaceae bacterium]|nr:MAG: DNA polymerase III subunit delta' [Hyphomicrobiaceae bacterium]
MARAPALQETEALPEADRLDGFPHPRETRALFGHEAAEKVLVEVFAGGRMHHGWLLAGREGIGKATLAYRLARFVLARPEERDALGVSLEVDPECSAARQVGVLSHPGLLVLRRPYDPKTKRFAASIPIDEVRRLKTFLGLTAGEGAWRVVIVDRADDLNINAANALLKSLEEPPPRALFLLVTAEPSRLLATIRSRSRRLDLAPLAAEPLKRAVAAALAAQGMDAPPPADWVRLERLAKGSVRRVLQLSASGGLELCERVEGMLASLPRIDWAAVHALSDQLAVAAQEQRFEAFHDLFFDLLARLVHVRATGVGDAGELSLAERLIPEHRVPAWAALWETLAREKREAMALNLDRKALIMSAFSRLEAVAKER